jgi:hypothetical protein
MDSICIICNKKYSSYKSLWNHNKKFHKNQPEKIHPHSTENTPNCTENTLNCTENAQKDTYIILKTECKFCNNVFSRTSSLKRHYMICKIKNNNYKKLEEQNEQLNKQLHEHSKKIDEITKMYNTILKKIKIHPKTLQKINNTLTNNNNNTNNTHNTINNTINIVPFCKENLSDIYSIQEKLDILRQGQKCFTKLIEYTYTNDKYPQFKNILITNLRDNIGYIYNTDTGKFEATTKDVILGNIIIEKTIHIYDFKDECDKYLSKDEKRRVQYVINKFDSNCPIFEAEQKNDIKLIIYNNRHKITKEPCRDIEIIL